MIPEIFVLAPWEVTFIGFELSFSSNLLYMNINTPEIYMIRRWLKIKMAIFFFKYGKKRNKQEILPSEKDGFFFVWSFFLPSTMIYYFSFILERGNLLKKKSHQKKKAIFALFFLRVTLTWLAIGKKETCPIMGPINIVSLCVHLVAPNIEFVLRIGKFCYMLYYSQGKG